MRFRRGDPAIATCLGLVCCGVAATVAWQHGLWGSLTGATLVAVWLCVLNWWAIARPRDMPSSIASPDADTDAMVLRILLDAAPTPLVGTENGAGRALNRAARRLFATDDRILPVPPELTDPDATHLRVEGRSWRIDRVALANGRSVAALIDIEQEERVAEARASAELIQVLGHELLNGLSPIASLAESGAAAMEQPDVDLDLLRDILHTLARRADGLQRFTEAYRELARLPEPAIRPARLREMADDLSRLFAGRWPGIGFSMDVDGDELWPLDRDQISQAIWALLQNAAEATIAAYPIAGLVTLRLQRADNALMIEITDNGAGISPDNVIRIFRPFHTTKAEGTGIGLSIARQIALAHGGSLDLDASAETRFRVVLPSR